MKKTLLLCLLCCSCLTISYAQRDTVPEPNAHHRHEIGLNIQPLINGDLPLAAIYKRRLKPKADKPDLSRSWRFQLSLVGSQGKVQDTTIVIEETDRELDLTSDNDHTLSVNIGREWSWRRGRNFSFYYGADILLSFIQSDRTFETNTPSGSADTRLTNRTTVTLNNGDRMVNRIYRAGITPFSGVKIHFANRFLVAIEAGLDMYYEQFNTTINRTPKSLGRFDDIVINESNFFYSIDRLAFLTIGCTF